MWMVYLWEDSPACGFSVESENAAFDYCMKHDGYTYSYISIW